MKLNEKDKELISQEIENLEKLSSAELVAVITKRSGDYKYATSLVSIFIVLDSVLAFNSPFKYFILSE